VEGEYWFEGTQFMTADNSEKCPNDTGTYQIQLLIKGGLRFFPVEDKCLDRLLTLQGTGGVQDPVQYEPVP
jgi:hypothetical protein